MDSIAVCIMHQTWTGDSFHIWYYTCFNAILGRPRGIWGGRREEGSGWGTHVYLWRIHFNTWQNQYNIVKLKKKRKKIAVCNVVNPLCGGFCVCKSNQPQIKNIKNKIPEFLRSKANLPHASNNLYGNYTVYITIYIIFIFY